MPVSHKEKCICQICICGEHRCEASKSKQIAENLSKSEERTWTHSEVIAEEQELTQENTLYEKGDHSTPQRDHSLERSRKQWETSPDQMKEISRSLSELNDSHLEKKDQQKTRTKRSKSKDSLIENQTNRSTLPPINSLSDSDSGKEITDNCICERMYKSNGVMDNYSESNQWVVSRPIRNKPKDNLRLEGLMDMETTFQNSYDSTAKQIKENNSKNVAIVLPSNKLSSDESNFERLKRSKINELNSIKSSKKKSKHRPSTSLKAGGDGYFNTINKESYKNFVIIDDKSKPQKSKSSSNGNNGKKTSVCCTTVSNIKLPKVDSNGSEDNQQANRRKSKHQLDHQSSQMEQINRSLQRMTTSDRGLEATHVSEKTQTNGNFCAYVDSSVQTNYDFHQIDDNQIENASKQREKKSNEKTLLIAHKDSEHRMANDITEANTSWTVGSLEEHKRIYTRDVDSIKELGLMDKTDQQLFAQIQQNSEEDKRDKASNGLRNEFTETARERVRYESKNYVQQQRRQKKHKNESSMKLFDGDMDFMTTTRTYYADKSPNRADPSIRTEREKTAGKRSRKSGRKRNLFRTSTEAEFYEPYGEKTTQTTYQKQFGDRLYCPAIDLGSNKSDFKYRGEASGHKFFLPAVNN